MIGVEADLMDVGAVRIHHVQQKDRLLAVVGLRRVLRAALVDQDGLSRRLPGRGKHDAAVGQIVCAHVVPRGGAVVGELGHRLRHRVVLVDFPRRLRDIGIGLVRIQRQTQREHQLLAVGRRVEIAHVAHAHGDRCRHIGLDGAGAGLLADIEIAAGNGGDQVAHVDIRLRSGRRRGAFHVGQRKIQGAGILGLHARESGGMSADSALAADHEQRRQNQRRQFQGTVTRFTCEQSVHGCGYLRSINRFTASVCIGSPAH